MTLYILNRALADTPPQKKKHSYFSILRIVVGRGSSNKNLSIKISHKHFPCFIGSEIVPFSRIIYCNLINIFALVQDFWDTFWTVVCFFMALITLDTLQICFLFPVSNKIYRTSWDEYLKYTYLYQLIFVLFVQAFQPI